MWDVVPCDVAQEQIQLLFTLRIIWHLAILCEKWIGCNDKAGIQHNLLHLTIQSVKCVDCNVKAGGKFNYHCDLKCSKLNKYSLVNTCFLKQSLVHAWPKVAKMCILTYNVCMPVSHIDFKCCMDFHEFFFMVLFTEICWLNIFLVKMSQK